MALGLPLLPALLGRAWGESRYPPGARGADSRVSLLRAVSEVLGAWGTWRVKNWEMGMGCFGQGSRGSGLL